MLSISGLADEGRAGSTRSPGCATATGSRRSTTVASAGRRRRMALTDCRLRAGHDRPHGRARARAASTSSAPRWEARPRRRSRWRIPTACAVSCSTGRGVVATASSTRSSGTGSGRRDTPTPSVTFCSPSTSGASLRRIWNEGTMDGWLDAAEQARTDSRWNAFCWSAEALSATTAPTGLAAIFRPDARDSRGSRPRPPAAVLGGDRRAHPGARCSSSRTPGTSPSRSSRRSTTALCAASGTGSRERPRENRMGVVAELAVSGDGGRGQPRRPSSSSRQSCPGPSRHSPTRDRRGRRWRRPTDGPSRGLSR